MKFAILKFVRTAHVNMLSALNKYICYLLPIQEAIMFHEIAVSSVIATFNINFFLNFINV